MRNNVVLYATLFGSLTLGCISVLPPPAHEPNPLQGVTVSTAIRNGLTDDERSSFYHFDIGIHYIPVEILMSLKRPVMHKSGKMSFQIYDQLLMEKPERLGLLPDLLHPDWPPVGISISTTANCVPMAGVNCATCHTGVFVKDGKGFYVDGGTGPFAIDRFFSEMVYAMVYTILSPTEFVEMYGRFRKKRPAIEIRVTEQAAIEEIDSGPEAQALHDEADRELDGGHLGMSSQAEAMLKKIHAKAEERPDDDIAIDAPAYPSSLAGAYPSPQELRSAFDVYAYLVERILFFNKVSSYGGKGDSAGLGRSNPWIVVQNMFAANAGKLNVGLKNKEESEFLPTTNGSAVTPFIWGLKEYRGIFWTGVTNSLLERNFAQGILLLTDFDWKTYDTTVSARGIHDVLELAYRLEPPKWPSEIFGTPDPALVEAGKAIFKAQCLQCHSPKTSSPGPGGKHQKYQDVGTDTAYYDGQARSFYGKDLFREVATPWITAVKKRAYEREGVPADDQAKWEEGRLPAGWQGPTGNNMEAKVLWGIWAAPPYLHNGAVMSIRELLTPPAQRRKSFWVGSYTYDTRSLGFTDHQRYYSSQLDTSKQGNSAIGHAFGVDLSDAQKDALIEFLKVYGPDTKLD